MGELQLEPFHKGLEEIAEMTDVQILNLAACAVRRTKNLNAMQRKTYANFLDPETATEEEMMNAMKSLALNLGFPVEQVEEAAKPTKKEPKLPFIGGG